MAEEQWKKSRMMFGSAGMKASGMFPKSSEDKRPYPVIETQLRHNEQSEKAKIETTKLFTDPEPTPAFIAEEIVKAKQPTDFKSLSPQQKIAVEEPAVVTINPTLAGYGINSKAQRLYSELSVAIIGSGSRLLHGFDWDQALSSIDGISVTGISNNDPQALADMQELHQITGGYLDYRELLAQTKPNLAVVAEKNTSIKAQMIKDALLAGAHVICPAPFTRSISDADELIALAERRGLKLAVSHPMRINSNVLRFHQEIDQTIGELIEMRIYGEMDQHSGGYDLLMHGAPLFDLMHLFAGNPLSANANIYSNGNKSSRDHIIMHEDLGPLVGDTIQAQIGTDKNIIVNFYSDSRLKQTIGGWGIDFIGSKNTMRLYAGAQPILSLRNTPAERKPVADEQWQQWPQSCESTEVDGLTGTEAAHRLLITDWITAISEDRKALSSGQSATVALEVCHAIFQSAMTNQKVYLPLNNRHHPLLPELKPLNYLKSA